MEIEAVNQHQGFARNCSPRTLGKEVFLGNNTEPAAGSFLPAVCTRATPGKGCCCALLLTVQSNVRVCSLCCMTLHDCGHRAHTFNSLQCKSRELAGDALNPRLPCSTAYKAGSFKGFRPVQTRANMMKVAIGCLEALCQLMH